MITASINITTDYLRTITLALTATMILALSAQIQVPYYPVPATLQSFVIIVIGMVMGWRLAAITLCLYLGEGLIGLPVFAGFQSGPAVLLGTHGGYLLGFIPSACLAGYCYQQGYIQRSWLWALGCTLACMSLPYLLGVSYLAWWLGWSQAITVGLMPFLALDGCKALLLSTIVPRLIPKR